MNRKVYCYKKADFDGLRSTSNYIPWDSVISRGDLKDSVTKFQDLLLCAMHRYVPRLSLPGRSRPPWTTAKIMRLIKKKKIVLEKNEDYSFPRSFHALQTTEETN